MRISDWSSDVCSSDLAGPQSGDPGAAATPEPARTVPAQSDAPSHEKGRLPGIAADDLPDVASLSLESDFTAFMQAGVPEELRKTALRRLLRLDPVFPNPDGLLEYGDGYTDPPPLLEHPHPA